MKPKNHKIMTKQYHIHELAELAGVSVRTLHHYDAIGLLVPSRNKENAYRTYDEEHLRKLQHILFYRELDFPLEEIRRIMEDPSFNRSAALAIQRELLVKKQTRLAKLINTIDRTITAESTHTPMDDNELYDAFKDDDVKAYVEEAKARWGNTDAWKQSMERTRRMTKADMAKLKKKADEFMRILATHVAMDPACGAAQQLIAQHYEGLRTFYDPNPALYRGLADMYIADPRFTLYYEKYAKGLAQFMHKAMHTYADTLEGRTK